MLKKQRNFAAFLGAIAAKLAALVESENPSAEEFARQAYRWISERSDILGTGFLEPVA